jgi:hypothetical protein
MPALDAVTATIALPFWAAGAFAALFVVAAVMAVRGSATARSLGALAGIAMVVVLAWSARSLIDGSAVRERATERRALDARAAELTARAIAPGSALACLDANAGETVDGACEKALFASPEAVAAATSYVAARLLLLADGVDYAARADRGYETALAGLRRSMETDRFGLVAHVLATRDACTPEYCAAFALLQDAAILKANLKARTYANNVARYAAVWSEPKAAPVAAAAAAPAAPAVASVPSSIVFPNASSIPPVSIMNPEPPAPVAAAAEPNAAARRPPAPATPPARRLPATNGAAPASVQTAPAASSAATAPRAP